MKEKHIAWHQLSNARHRLCTSDFYFGDLFAERGVMKTYDRRTVPFLGLFWLYGGCLRWLVLAVTLGILWSFPTYPRLIPVMVVAVVVLLAFFRCPRCGIPDVGNLVSPATGRIDDLEIVEDCPRIGAAGTKIGIFLSVFDVHVTRAPISGRVKAKQFVPGRCGNAMSRSVGYRNQRNEILLETDEGKPIFMRQISGAIARRVVFDPALGDQIQAGAIVGMIRFGSRVEVFVPDDSGFLVQVSKGDRVQAGVTVLGRAV